MGRYSSRKVIVVLSLRTFSGQGKLRGIERFLNEGHPWEVDIRCGDEWITRRALREAVADGYRGILLLCHPVATKIDAVSRSGIPAVIETATSPGSDDNTAFISFDTKSAITSATSYFLSRQAFAGFGYVHTNEANRLWSLDRARFFRMALGSRGHDCATVDPSKENLMRWLKAQPKPLAVLAANDATARHVTDTCLKAGLRIPDEVAVMGIDDDPSICLSADPPLSSIHLDFESCGYLAASTLEQIINGHRGFLRKLHYGIREIVVRTSTANVSPNVILVQRALDFIDRKACDGIGVPDVCAHLGLSRRLTDLRFHETLGRSVHEIIAERRFEEVKRLLRNTNLPLARINEQAGFANNSHLKTVFKRKFGVSMREFRNAQSQN